jgi:Cu/Ag efflux pump CusA
MRVSGRRKSVCAGPICRARAHASSSGHGRPDDGTDATGFFNAEFFVPLKPFDTWPAGVDKGRLTAEMTARFNEEFPGVDFNFSRRPA